MAIFIAMLLDGIDGRLARLTHTTSAFGAQYDSLADMISFGVAPALLIYSWRLADLGKPGWIAAFVFVAATALRLARFNTQTEHTEKRFFQGLPCTAGAGVVASTVWLVSSLNTAKSVYLDSIMAILTVVLGLLMISGVRYYSFKEIGLRDKVPFIILFVMLLVIMTVVLSPPAWLLFFIFNTYAVFGVVFTITRWLRRYRIMKQLVKKK